MALRHDRRRIALWSALGVALTLVLVMVFDELWLRPMLQSYVRDHAGRRVDFDEIHLGLDEAWQPTVQFKNLTIENAVWASSRQPLIRAGRFGVALTWASFVSHGAVVVSRMTLRDADVDLEILADGLRNWRLAQPEDRGPGRIRVSEVDAQRVRMRVVHRGVDLEVTLDATLLPTAKPAPLPGGAPLTRAIAIHGIRRGFSFDGQWSTSDILSLDASPRWTSLAGELSIDHAEFALQGRARNLVHLDGLEGRTRLSGDRVRDLADVFGPGPLGIPVLATRFDSRVVKDGEHWRFESLSGRFGDSDVAGMIDYRTNKESGARPIWKATLTSERVNMMQLGGHVNDSMADHDWRAAPDASVDWKIGALQGLPLAIGEVHAVFTSAPGHLRLEPVDLLLAGGRVSGKVTLDTTTVPETVGAELRIRGLQAERLGAKNVVGQLDAQLMLTSHGFSPKALVAGLSGTAVGALTGASLPAKLEAELGLDGGRWLKSLVADEQRVPVICSTLQVQVEHGVARVRRLALETGNVLVNGAGSADLPKHTLDVVLTPYRKHAALVALDRSIRVSGGFKGLQVAVVDKSETSHREACAKTATP